MKRIGVSIILSGLLAACATTAENNATQNESTEYTVGSNIPRHVRKDAGSDNVQTITNQNDISQVLHGSNMPKPASGPSN